MSDMIDRLHEVAAEAGADSGERLAAGTVEALLGSQIRRGVRRRRLTAATVTTAVVVLAAATALVVPQLMRPAPVAPAGDPRVPVETTEGLITYSDGSMKVLTEAGDAIDVPAGSADAPVFSTGSDLSACAATPPAPSPGWTRHFPEAFELVKFGRPLVVDEAGYHVLAQGERLPVPSANDKVKFAFSVDVDPAIAPHVAMVARMYALGPDGTVGYYATQLDSEPAVDYTGTKEAGTYTATLTTRAFNGGMLCPGVPPGAKWPAGTEVLRYFVVSVLLYDGAGNINPLATHTSWVTLVKEDA